MKDGMTEGGGRGDLFIMHRTWIFMDGHSNMVS